VPVSQRGASSSPAQLPVQTYQLWIEKDGLRIVSPQGYEPKLYPIKSDESSLSHRTLMALHGMLRDNRLREGERELFGQYLYDVLLADEAGEMLHEALRQPPFALLHVELHFNNAPTWLGELPWEYLYRPATKSGGGYFLAMEERLALVRRPTVPDVKRTLGVSSKEELKVLLVACSPSDQEPLEFAAFIEAMRRLPGVTVKTLTTPYIKDRALALAEHGVPEATFDNFEEAIRDNPHIVHFLGHGKVDSQGGSIAFVDHGFNADWCECKRLQKVFRESSVRLAFLQACETSVKGDAAMAYRALSSVAGALADTGVPAIVAMQAKIEIGKASSFATVFYSSIVEQRLPLFRAMQLARQKAKDAECIPVLYLRYDGSSGTQADLLFEESTSDSPQAGLSRGGSVTVADDKCPWCWGDLVGKQAEQDCCPYCASDLRCCKCKVKIEGLLPKDREEVRCQKCRVRIIRYRDPVDEGPRSQTTATVREFDHGPELTVRGDKQKDVFGSAGEGGPQ